MRLMKVLIRIICCLVFCAFIATCHSDQYVKKMDVPLRSALSQSDTTRIHFSVICQQVITDSLKKELVETGVIFQTIIENQFTAFGTAESINDLAKIPVVLKLVKAKKTRLPNP